MTTKFVQQLMPAIDPADMIRQERAVRPFNRVLLKGYGDLEIVPGPLPALTITTHKHLIDRIGSEVDDGRLTLGFLSWWDKLRQSFTTSLDRYPIHYRLTVSQLVGLEIQGLGHIRGRAIQSDRLAIRVRGIADIQLHDLQAGELVVHMAPGGRILLDGSVREQRLTIKGPGLYQAPDLDTQEADIHIQGPGQAVIRVREHLRVTIHGPGRVTYAGTPRVEKKLIGPALLQRG